MTEDELKPGMMLKVRQATNTISQITYEVEVEIVWVDNRNVHYRKTTQFGESSPVRQTTMERFLDIVNNQPKARH